jgi:hypothetical protein
MRDIAKRLQGTDFRHAVQAIAALRGMDRAQALQSVPAVDAPDEQRAFQLAAARVVAQEGVLGLAARWRELPGIRWRESFIVELGQVLAWWDREDTLELVQAALEDTEGIVAGRAVVFLKPLVLPMPGKERKSLSKTQRGKASLEAIDRMAAWITPSRRARLAAAIAGALERCAENPRELTWPDWYIELLGHTAMRGDARALAALERLRAKAGEPRRTEFEKLDPDNLPWETAMVAERKGIAPGTPFIRVKSVGTGLLDLGNLERAIAAIQGR